MSTLRSEGERFRSGTLLVLLASVAVVAAMRPAFAELRQKPPSSLHKPSALVRVVHTHDRVASCRPAPDGTACREHRVTAMATTDVAFQPVASQLISVPEASRHATNLKLSGASGSAKGELRLEPGDWALIWEDQRSVIRVSEQLEFSIRLSSVSGVCILVDKTCQKSDGPVRRVVSIPAEFLVGQ